MNKKEQYTTCRWCKNFFKKEAFKLYESGYGHIPKDHDYLICARCENQANQKARDFLKEFTFIEDDNGHLQKIRKREWAN